MPMLLSVPEKLNTLAQRAEFPLYVVGGAVRDALANLPSRRTGTSARPFPPSDFPPSPKSAG